MRKDRNTIPFPGLWLSLAEYVVIYFAVVSAASSRTGGWNFESSYIKVPSSQWKPIVWDSHRFPALACYPCARTLLRIAIAWQPAPHSCVFVIWVLDTVVRFQFSEGLPNEVVSIGVGRICCQLSPGVRRHGAKSEGRRGIIGGIKTSHICFFSYDVTADTEALETASLLENRIVNDWQME